MAKRVTRFLASHHPERVGCSDENTSLEDVEFEFLEDGGESLVASTSRDEICHPNEMVLDEAKEEDDDDDDDDEDSKGIEHNESFWDDQLQRLLATLCRSSSVETRIRAVTKEAIKAINQILEASSCDCENHKGSSFCKKCSLRTISSRLQSGGYNSAFCRTKWRTSPPDIPSGEHNFVDVVDSTSSRKREMRVIVELNFRAEFEMARASEDYNRLVRQLPEVFVGKAERLRTLIKIMCMAARRCMKENKMHMGPWRRKRYMQSKWLGPCERNTSATLFTMVCSERMIPKTNVKQKTSMLTIDLLKKQPNMHCIVVVS